MKVKKLNALKSFIQSLTDGTDLRVTIGDVVVTLMGRNGKHAKVKYDAEFLGVGVYTSFSRPGGTQSLQVSIFKTDEEASAGGWEKIPTEWLAAIVRNGEKGLLPRSLPSFDLVFVRIEAADQILIPVWDEEGVAHITSFPEQLEDRYQCQWETTADDLAQALAEDDFWAKRWPFGETVREPLSLVDGTNWPETARIFRDYWGNRALVALSRAAYDAMTAHERLTADVAG